MYLHYRSSSRRLVVAMCSCLLLVFFGAMTAITTSAASVKGTNELSISFLADMGPPDPDIFYSSEGLAVIGALYEGLLQYKLNNTNSVAPLLATSWNVSSDAKTYTFHLRSGVKFHDGTAFTSTAAKLSFERRLAVGGGSAYMLYAVASMDTPNPLTFVVHLKHPVSAFLSYMASPYGPFRLTPQLSLPSLKPTPDDLRMGTALSIDYIACR